MAAYRYFSEGQLKVDPTTGTKCRTGQLNHQFVEQKFVGGVWVGIGDNDGVRYGDVAGEGCRFREGVRDGDYVVDVELEVAGFLLAENDGWENIGLVIGSWTQQTRVFMDASGILNDDTVYYNGTAYEQNGNNIWRSVNRFIRGIIEDGLLAKLISFYPFIGENYNQAKYNLVNPIDTDAAHRLLQGNTPVFNGLGVTFNGNNNYLKTNVIPSAQGASNNLSVGSYILATGTQAKNLYGVRQGENRIELIPNYNGTSMMSDLPGYPNRINVSIPNGGIGFWQFWTDVNRLNFSVDDIDQIGKVPLSATTMPTKEIYLGCLNNDGSPQDYNACSLSMWYYGIDMTSEDTSNLAIIANRLMIDLKRITL